MLTPVKHDAVGMPQRKKTRLEGFDYSSCGAYFVTICVQNREERLRKVGANCVRPHEIPPLSDIGVIAEAEIQRLGSVYEAVTVDAYCIMPDHIHMLIRIDSDADGRTQFAPTLSRIIKQFKGSLTKQIGTSIWQRSFYDKVIRDEQGYLEAWRYIDENPLKIGGVFP